MRVNELARDLGLSSKDLLAELHTLGIEAKSHSSALTPEQIEQVRRAHPGSPAAPAAAAPRPAPAPASAPAAKPAAVKAPPSPPAPPPTPPKPEPKTIVLRMPIVVKEFAEQLGLKPNLLIAELMTMNVFASINEKIDVKVAHLLADKHGVILEQEKKAPEHKPPPKPEVKPPAPTEDRPEDLLPRPPVVTFMGHVDHGKTSLLDRIRNTSVAAGEHGGITQHIGASMIEFRDRTITFIDTPGHAAFTAMRARGANLTDIAVIVIAADDGIMPQTREAIKHAQAAEVCIVAAINKIDLPAANVERVKRQLQQEGLTADDWGGEVVCCPVSAVTGQGLDHLLEMILLQAEMLDLKASARPHAEGYVLEACLEPGTGPTATLLVTRGTLQLGDPVVCGPCWGRVKALISDRGIKVRTAGPSYAVQCTGLNSVPEAGAEFRVCESDRAARALAEEELAKKRLAGVASPKRATLDDLFDRTTAQPVQLLNIVLKADSQGTLEAIQQALSGVKSDKVTLKVVLTGVGNITENDVLLATASNAIIIGFHVALDSSGASASKREGTEVRLYSIIYELLDEVRNAMAGLLEPVVREKIIGHAEIRQLFTVGKRSHVAGCMVKDGRVAARARARIERDRSKIYEGSVASLRRFENDASEVREGQECGLRLENFSDFQVGDIIEFYETEKIAQQL